MIAAVPWSPAWQGLLDGLGWVVARIYDVIPNFGVTIIALTVLIRLVLLPLGIKQIRSMQHMQVIQPKIKAVQTKYKGNKQKQQEEIMKLYKEHGVNPFSGCWPVLLQFPILIAMYSVVRFPQHPIHIPEGTKLYSAIVQEMPPGVRTDGSTCTPSADDPSCAPVTTQAQIDELDLPEAGSKTSFLYMNLLCSAIQAGNPHAKLGDRVSLNGKSTTLEYPVDCGSSAGTRVPYYAFALLMFGSTYYQQRQMQRASPPGAASQQQQAMLKIMPIMFGVFGIFFPAGLVLYWTTSNAWQIGQQYFMLKNRPTAETLAARADGESKPAKKGFLAAMMERAERERTRREAGGGKPGTRKPGSSGSKGRPGSPGASGSKPGQAPPRAPKKPGPGGNGAAGGRKKRPKR